MYEFLKSIAEDNNWVFEYSRTDYQNLVQDVETGKIYLFVDSITTDTKFSDAGNETVTYSGKLMLLLSSDVDEEYSDKYTQYIQPLISGGGQTLKSTFSCSSYQINSWKQLEVINLFDENLDGIMVTYNVTLID